MVCQCALPLLHTHHSLVHCPVVLSLNSSVVAKAFSKVLVVGPEVGECSKLVITHLLDLVEDYPVYVLCAPHIWNSHRALIIVDALIETLVGSTK